MYSNLESWGLFLLYNLLPQEVYFLCSEKIETNFSFDFGSKLKYSIHIPGFFILDSLNSSTRYKDLK